MAKKVRKLKQSRVQESYDSRETSGTNRKGILDFSKLEEKREWWKPVKGANKLNIIPYEVKSKNHPLVKKGSLEVGDLDYVLDIWAHRFVGPNKADIVCPKKNYGKACPICEEASNLWNAGQQDEAKALFPSRRVLYNIQPITKGEPGELQIYEGSYSLFEKELIEEARECANGEDIINFADVETGKTIRFRASEQTFGKNKYFEFKSFAFEDRDEELEDSIIDEAISFDDLLVVLTYDQIQAEFLGLDADDEDEPVKKKSKKLEPDEEEEDEDEEPQSKKKKPAPKPEPEDEEDEEEEEKPTPKKASKKASKHVCSFGYAFGVDTDTTPDCKKCDIWEECVEASS